MTQTHLNELTWRDGVPVSSKFDDPYYSLDDGLAESRYVFHEGAEIQRLLEEKTHIVIAETGFGTGLNFLATWQAWRATKTKTRITYISVEAYPLSIQNLEKAHTAFPELAGLSRELCSKWPPPAPGFHMLSFEDGAINLLLLFGDAAEMFSKLSAKVDAWYLDGFAPAKNPGMWTDALFSQMARLSNQQAPIATFTAAGFVRRGLIVNGFSIKKAPGFGRKRERLLGKYDGCEITAKESIFPAPRWATIQPSKHKSVAVIGAGIGGLMTAHALKKRGAEVMLFHDPAANNTSENLPAAILAPKFILGRSPEQQFYASAFAFAAQHDAYIDEKQADQGTTILAKTTEEKDRLNKIADTYKWPDTWLQSGEDQIFLPNAKTVNPRGAIGKLSQELSIKNHSIHKLKRLDGMWQLFSAAGDKIAEVDTVVLAAGIDSTGILQRSGLQGGTHDQHPELRANAGQMEVIPNSILSKPPITALSYGGYISGPITSADGGVFRGIGSTYERLNDIPKSTPSIFSKKRKENLEKLYKNTGIRIDNSDASHSWTGLRATVADHLPFAGPIPKWNDLIDLCQTLALDAKNKLPREALLHQGLYMLAGLGSKGFQYAPILGEYIAAMITDEPLPLPTDFIARLHPARGAVRNIIRKNPR